MLSAAYFKGIGLGGSLIMAIGAQNAFLLKVGLQRRHALACALVCIVCDVFLIACGAAGMGTLVNQHPAVLGWLKLGGAIFLLEYGRRAALAAWRPAAGSQGGALIGAMTRTQVVTTALGLSLLNPHALLDTVVLLGSIGVQQPGDGRFYFAGGAMTASLIWFTALGLGARLMAPWFARPAAWRVLDALVALLMAGLALALLIG